MHVRPVAATDPWLPPSDTANLVTTPAWLKAWDGKACAYGVFDGTEVQAVFAIQRTSRFGISMYTDTPMAPHCGLAFRPHGGNVEKLNTWHKEIMAAIAAFVDRSPWSVVSLVFPDWATDFQPFLWRGFKVLTRYTYQLELQRHDESGLLAEMSDTRRRQIRNAEKHGLVVEPLQDMATLEHLVAATCARQQIPHPEDAVGRVLHTYANTENSFAFVVRHSGDAVAAVFCVQDGRRAYYLLGGVDDTRSVPAAAPVAMFACIRHARSLGLRIFDFEGSDIPGVERYFRSFGGRLTPLCRVVKAALPLEMLLKPFKRSLF